MLLVLFLVLPAFAQLPKGVFLSDSVTIGQPFSFSFSFRHAPDANIIFPDSSYNFAPFELIGMQIFPTSTNKKGSLDSVIYVFKTFTFQPMFTLSLPVYLATDSSVFVSPTDTVWLTQLIDKKDISKIGLKSDYTTVGIDQPVDVWKYLQYLLIVASIIGGYYFLLWDFTYRQYLLFVYQIRHRDFIAKFRKFIRDAENPQAVREAMILWKTHLQELENIPFTTLTTKEIIEAIPNQRLGEALRTMDMTIYGDVQSPQMVFAMSKLLEIANERYGINRKEYKEKLREKTKKITK